jgi:hypothetical protein
MNGVMTRRRRKNHGGDGGNRWLMIEIWLSGVWESLREISLMVRAWVFATLRVFFQLKAWSFDWNYCNLKSTNLLPLSNF